MVVYGGDIDRDVVVYVLLSSNALWGAVAPRLVFAEAAAGPTRAVVVTARATVVHGRAALADAVGAQPLSRPVRSPRLASLLVRLLG